MYPTAFDSLHERQQRVLCSDACGGAMWLGVQWGMPRMPQQEAWRHNTSKWGNWGRWSRNAIKLPLRDLAETPGHAELIPRQREEASRAGLAVYVLFYQIASAAAKVVVWAKMHFSSFPSSFSVSWSTASGGRASKWKSHCVCWCRRLSHLRSLARKPANTGGADPVHPKAVAAALPGAHKTCLLWLTKGSQIPDLHPRGSWVRHGDDDKVQQVAPLQLVWAPQAWSCPRECVEGNLCRLIQCASYSPLFGLIL